MADVGLGGEPCPPVRHFARLTAYKAYPSCRGWKSPDDHSSTQMVRAALLSPCCTHISDGSILIKFKNTPKPFYARALDLQHDRLYILYMILYRSLAVALVLSSLHRISLMSLLSPLVSMVKSGGSCDVFFLLSFVVISFEIMFLYWTTREKNGEASLPLKCIVTPQAYFLVCIQTLSIYLSI